MKGRWQSLPAPGVVSGKIPPLVLAEAGADVAICDLVADSGELAAVAEEIKKMSDKSPADVLKEAVGLEIHSTSDAYTKGYLTAEINCCVSYHCSVCGKVITIDTKKEKEAVAQYMKDYGWCHGDCLKK